ncbi:MAG: MarR family winged helix-turn-helix transcriptional regulator [Pseudoclavibacter sp.]
MSNAELPEEAIFSPLTNVIDEATFTPRLLAMLANIFATTEARELRRRFGHSITDWRVLSAVARRPGTTAARIAATVLIDKGEVSRSANALTRGGYIVSQDGARRSKHLFLTEEGARLHDRMLPVSMRGQRLVEQTVTPSEFQTLTGLLSRLIDQASDGTAWPAEPEPGAPDDSWPAARESG